MASNEIYKRSPQMAQYKQTFAHTHTHILNSCSHTVITLLAPATALCVCIETNKVGSIHKAVKAVTKFGLVLCSLLSGAA